MIADVINLTEQTALKPNTERIPMIKTAQDVQLRAAVATLKPLAARVIATRLIADDLRERVNAIADSILATGQWFSQYDGTPITVQSRAWTMPDADHKTYNARLMAQVAAAGMFARPECCPALTAESDQRDAEHALLVAGQELPGCAHMTTSRLLCSGTKDRTGLETLHLYTDTLVKLALAA